MSDVRTCGQERCGIHRIEVSRDQAALELMSIRGKLLAYLDVTEVTAPERRYVKQAETLIAAALVNLEDPNDE